MNLAHRLPDQAASIGNNRRPEDAAFDVKASSGAHFCIEAGGVCRHHLGGPFVLMAGKGHVLCGTAELVDDIARVLNTVQPRAS